MHHVDVQRGTGMGKKTIGAALRASLPVMAGYIVLGMGFGVLLAVAAVVGLHLWKKNTLLSIFGGTAFYMLLVQEVFA